ncbi:hypothetical protein [Flavivirga algicola]|uniref:Uncharacterized protein n=1 Tax=Flavivirga algicola TaxID=2729136 RepID=A0ABX1S1Y8_9FLAO|nr:hypothetical protein [Flavivirga algicola]NMH88642.1 hypothetical protein [Flavivirga algicola]
MNLFIYFLGQTYTIVMVLINKNGESNCFYGKRTKIAGGFNMLFNSIIIEPY